MIERHFLESGISPQNAVFDPVPSYDGHWKFAIKNLRKNAISNELWDEFYKETYKDELKKIFDGDIIFNRDIDIISMPNENKIGRCLRYNKIDFFSELSIFINKNIDRQGLDEKQNFERIKSLFYKIEISNEEINLAYSESMKEHASRLKDVMDKGFDSKYFESAMLDYERYTKRDNIKFEDYIKNEYLISSKIQMGLLKLGDFFDRNIDIDRLYSLFDPDKFCLLFAKIIYEFNLLAEKEYKALDNSYGYLCIYRDMIRKEVESGNKKYNPKIYYKLDKKENPIMYSRWDFINEFNEIMERHPEVKSIKLPSLEDDDKYKDINLINKLAKLYSEEAKVNWEFLPEGEGIKRGTVNKSLEHSSIEKKDKEELIKEVNMRINILEDSGYIGRPIKGLDTFTGYYAFVYSSGKVILEKFWENEATTNPAVGNATYVMTIDNFVEMSKMSKLNLIEYIKTLPEIGVKRIFHTNINNWQRNLYDEINGTYRLDDVIDFINGLNKGEKRHE